MLERYLIEHCSPTLASLKTANLFSCEFLSDAALEQDLCNWNEYFSGKGVSILVLRKRGNRALVYVYREHRLKRDLERPGVADFLQENGYNGTDVDSAIATLRAKLEQWDEFPHEIGLFLGYPLGDVIGFIQNEGRNCKCTGCWKVYCNECEACKLFAQYRKCKEVYTRLWKQGRSVLLLTVAA